MPFRQRRGGRVQLSVNWRGGSTDQANIISAPAKASIEAKLQNLEDKSGIQLVVATVSSLEGGDIESYANGLFRAWKLGLAKKNNGVLFLIAPNERKMRIEVGYGLEGVLTDAVSSVIIRSAVAPRFKAGDFNGGIERGVDAIIDVLSSDTSEWTKRAAEQSMSETIDQLAPIILFLLFVFIMIYMSRNARGGRGGGPMIFLPPGGGFRRRRRWFWRRRLRRRRIFRRRRIVGRRRRLGGLVMRVSNEDYRRVAEAIRARGTKNRRRNRLRAGAALVGLFLRAGAVGEFRRAGDALAAYRVHAFAGARNLRGANRGVHRGGAAVLAVARAFAC